MSMKLMITTAAALAVLAGPALAAKQTSLPRGYYAQAPRADASMGPRQGFEGFPSDYLLNRFGDRQLQGR
jgi:hypothetical protein